MKVSEIGVARAVKYVTEQVTEIVQKHRENTERVKAQVAKDVAREVEKHKNDEEYQEFIAHAKEVHECNVTGVYTGFDGVPYCINCGEHMAQGDKRTMVCSGCGAVGIWM